MGDGGALPLLISAGVLSSGLFWRPANHVCATEHQNTLKCLMNYVCVLTISVFRPLRACDQTPGTTEWDTHRTTEGFSLGPAVLYFNRCIFMNCWHKYLSFNHHWPAGGPLITHSRRAARHCLTPQSLILNSSWHPEVSKRVRLNFGLMCIEWCTRLR